MKAVIMAGGFGTRIQPLTINMPKPMIPLVNRPIMLHTVELLKKHGIDELVMLLHHQPDNIKNFFGDGSEFGVRITYVTPLEDLGTAGAVKAAAKYLREPFLIISGDLLTDFNLTEVLQFHAQNKAKATITLTSVKDPLQFGVVITDKEGRITKFLEKPGWSEVFSDTINTGIYVINPDVLDLIPEDTNRDWSHDVFPKMLEQDDALYGCKLTGYWADVGNTDSYIDTSSDILQHKVAVNLCEKRVAGVTADLCLGVDAGMVKADEVETEGMVILGENSQVRGKARLKNCVVGRNCVIEEGVVLDGAILWDNVYVNRDTVIKKATVCNRVRLGKGVVIEDGAVIADDTRIGDKALIRQDIKIWPRKVIESGSTVTANMIWGEKWRKILFEGAQVRGLTNVELTPEFAARLGAAYGSTLPKDSVILAGRDAIRASRMLKRAFVGGLLSAGINVIDITMVSIPILRYKLTTFGEVGGVHFRQSPEDPAATEMIFYDGEGSEISTNMAKGIERIYFKENFRRVQYSEPGSISDVPRLFDYYSEHYLKSLNAELMRKKRPKVVIDLNHSPAGSLLPDLLTELGCEVIELNSHVIDSRTGISEADDQKRLQQLSRIVVTLEAMAGFLLRPSGERLNIIDDKGVMLSDIESLETLVALVCTAHKKGSIVVPVQAPETIEKMALKAGMIVKRSKANGRSIGEAARDKPVLFSAAMAGRFAFPALHANCDALYTVGKTIEMLCATDLSLSEIRSAAEKSTYLHEEVSCSWDYKGGIMRKMSEDSVDLEASFLDGVKVRKEGGWLLMLPDPYRPVAHLYAESQDKERAEKLIEAYREKLEKWKGELQQGDRE